MTPKKILIIDDDKGLLRGLNVRLRATGYNTALATDAVSAISVARKEEPDVIILDIGLPCGDGFTVMQRLMSLASTSATPIIVITGRDPSTTKERALQAGAVAFLQKPFDNDELLAAIQKALGEPSEGKLPPS
jgi:two-component system KDP operon response regulator KdpE